MATFEGLNLTLACRDHGAVVFSWSEHRFSLFVAKPEPATVVHAALAITHSHLPDKLLSVFFIGADGGGQSIALRGHFFNSGECLGQS